MSAVLSKLAVLKQCTDRSSSLLFLFQVPVTLFSQELQDDGLLFSWPQQGTSDTQILRRR